MTLTMLALRRGLRNRTAILLAPVWVALAAYAIYDMSIDIRAESDPHIKVTEGVLMNQQGQAIVKCAIGADSKPHGCAVLPNHTLDEAVQLMQQIVQDAVTTTPAPDCKVLQTGVHRL